MVLIIYLSIDLKEIFFSVAGTILGFVLFDHFFPSKSFQERSNDEIEEEMNKLPELYFSEKDIQNIDDNYINILTCSIDSSLIRCPVISPYSFTYEKESIVNWIKLKPTCPLTNQKLTMLDLRSNKNIQNVIDYLILKERFNKENPNNKISDIEILQ